MKTLSIIFFLVTYMLLTSCVHVRPWTPTEKVLLATSWVAIYADYTSTVDILDHGGYERNPLIGSHPSNEKLLVMGITSQIIAITIAHFWPETRVWILGGKTAIHTGCAIHNNNEY